MNNKCIYYVEGPCEQQLIAALKQNPAKLIPGKIKVLNVIQNLIPKSQMLSIELAQPLFLCSIRMLSKLRSLKRILNC